MTFFPIAKLGIAGRSIASRLEIMAEVHEKTDEATKEVELNKIQRKLIAGVNQGATGGTGPVIIEQTAVE
ncbi:hypothetical protein J3P89_15935 [Pseudomonas sp. Z1-14]|uniref:hypothetical protein n=1 Tax=Pseudomonas sp. Z1-14 TaxID=2817409 RepID=UPI003DA8F40B